MLPAKDGKGAARYWGVILFLILYALGVLVFAEITKLYAQGVAALFAYCLVLHPLFHFFFIYFEKKEKEEIAAEARMTLTVSDTTRKLPLLWNGEVDLIRLPKRGTHETSPHLFGMVCGRKKNDGQQVLELRIVRTEGLELPSAGEEAWLVTSENKVVEGHITAVIPGKPLPKTN